MLSRIPVKGPFKGIRTDIPPCTDPLSWDGAVNFIARKARMKIRPGLDLADKFTSPDGSAVLNMTSFVDAENYLHTVALTALNAYMLTAGPVLNLLTYPRYIVTATVNATGANYEVGDLLEIIQAGGSGGVIEVDAVDGGGAITASHLQNPGNGYTDASGLATGGSATGTGATVDIVTTQLASLGGPNSTRLPYSVVKAENRVYFCNGSVPVCFIDGEATFKIAGNVPGACRFLVTNRDHMIGAVWTEPDPTQNGAILYPNRIRWSDSGNFEEWDESLPAATAGVVDLIDTPDVITGVSTINTSSYIYRTNGISQMTATGIGSNPFAISNFSIAPKGEGNLYPYSLVSHNNVDRFIGNYDVWAFDGTNFAPLMDGKVNDAFYATLANAMGTVRGIITPVLAEGYQFLAYVLTVPGSNTAWAMDITTGEWTQFKWAPPVSNQTGFYDLQLIEEVYLS